MDFFYAINVLLCTLASVRIVNCRFPPVKPDPPRTNILTNEFSVACNYRGYRPAGDGDGNEAIVLRVNRREKSATVLETIVEKYSWLGKAGEAAVNVAGNFFPPLAVFKSVYDEFFSLVERDNDKLAAGERAIIALAKDVTRAFQTQESRQAVVAIDNRVKEHRKRVMELGIRLIQLGSTGVINSGVPNMDIILVVPIFNDIFRESASSNDIYLIFIDKVEGWIKTPGSGPTVNELIELEARFNLLPMYVETLFLVGFQTLRIHCHDRQHSSCNYFKGAQKDRIEKVIKYARNVFTVITNVHRDGTCAETFDVENYCNINKKVPNMFIPSFMSDPYKWEGRCDCQMDKYLEDDSCRLEHIISFERGRYQDEVTDPGMMSAMARRLETKQGTYLGRSLPFITEYWTKTVMLLETSWRQTADADIAKVDSSSRGEVPSAEPDVSDADKKKAQEIIDKLKKKAKDIVDNSIKVDLAIEKNLGSIDTRRHM